MEITLNKTESKRMLKVKDALNDMFNNGNLSKYKVSQYDAGEIARCYNGIVNTMQHCGLIVCSSAVENFFKKLGFLVEEKYDAVGSFDVYISDRMKKLCADR